MSIAMAPGLSKVVLFEAPNNSQYFDVILDSMAAHPEIKQLSSSWSSSADYTDQTADFYFERMAVQGQSFYCASGDHNAYNFSTINLNGKRQSSSPGFPESDTNITEVGGTILGMHAKGVLWASDIVWNTGYHSDDSLYWGSAGGVSRINTIPSWQKAVSTLNNNRSTIMRNVPDVSMTADSIYINIGNFAYIFSGTSCAAPLWAGFTALVNQQAAAAGSPTVGYINPAIYSIGNGTKYSADFHDVTSGNNSWPGSPSLYNAVTGYDLATGWGTPSGLNLIDDLSGTLPGQFTNGIISPASGNTSTQFSSSISYLSPTGQVPDSVNVIIDNKSYKMTAQGISWKNGVIFSYALPGSINPGQHNYYFRGSIAGSVIIRYPLSGTQQFTILSLPPAVVQQISPLNNSTGNIQPIKLKWMNSAGAVSYRLQIGTDSSLSTTKLDTLGLTDTSFSIAGLSNLMTYYWRVDAANLIGTSAWSNTWNFKTLGNPRQAAIIYPLANSQNIPVSLTFRWNKSLDQLTKFKILQYNEAKKVSNVSKYWFELTIDTSSNSYTANDSTLIDTAKQVSGLLNLTDYWWRVSAMNQAGWGAFTNWNKFTTIIAAPEIVIKVSPVSNSLGMVQPVQLIWRSSAGAITYRLQVSTDSTFTTIFNDTLITDTTCHANRPNPFGQNYSLNNLTKYYWRVNASNFGGTSPWSQVWNFTTLGNPEQVVLVYPSANSINIPVTLYFKWNKTLDQLTARKNEITKNTKSIATVSQYWFELTADTTSPNYLFNIISITDTTVHITGLKKLTNYWWRVSAMNETGWGAFTNWSEFSTIIDTPGVASLLSPISSSTIIDTAKSILFKWKSASFASTYELQIASNSNFNPALTDTSGITDTVFSYHTGNLTPTFYWRVRGSNIAGNGQWSAANSVSIISGIHKLKNGIPDSYTLYQNYPNPFNPSTMIRFDLPSSSNVKIEIYNILGEKVRELLNGQKSAGYYEVNFNTTGLSSGVYLYLLTAKSNDGKNEFRATKKMMLLK